MSVGIGQDRTTTLRFALRRAVSLSQALPFAESMRRAARASALSLLGVLPREFDDHPPDGLAQNHAHPFWLLEDADGDGWADHVVVHLPRGATLDHTRVLDHLLSGSVGLAACRWSGAATATPGTLMRPARRWRSLTPFVANVHVKRGRDPTWALLDEMRKRGMPRPTVVEHLTDVRGGFVLVRRTGTMRQGRSHHAGAFFRLVFAEKVGGPLAFGFSCHLGLGLFEHDVPERHGGVRL